MTRVPFGTSASPFLLTATLVHHLNGVNGDLKSTAELLRKSVYVDDLLVGSSTIEEAALLQDQASRILADAGMKLRKWSTNATELQNSFDGGSTTSAFSEPKGVLGLLWRRDTDTLAVPVERVLNFVTCSGRTKRYVLRAAARVFDPLGLLAPFVIRVKVLFQRIWECGLGWDDDLTDELLVEWRRWSAELPQIQTVLIRRCVMKEPREIVSSLQLHIFCDASPVAYGTCAYLRVEGKDGKVEVNLVFSKSRVAPIKRLTLPRLELMAAVIGRRIGQYLGVVMNIQEVFYWTDSMITLHWIRGSAAKWKPFVANRVIEIQAGGGPSAWKHCPGLENPADLMTRGISAEDLQTSKLWWWGPTWLVKAEEAWPNFTIFDNVLGSLVEEEGKREYHALQTTTETRAPLLELERYGTLERVLRITAWIMRFFKNCREQSGQRKGPLTAEELGRAET
uniref:Putative transposable element n=1 Tax=Ixodes ricinus TaxID=34613 RepID=A0A6B0VB60_IXORI